MTKEEQIKAKAKEQFPNDEFKQQIVIYAINWATKELQKQIEIDAEQIRALQKQNGELTDKCRELEANCDCEKCYSLARAYRNDNEKLKAQIEKMKRCSICKYSTDLGYCKIRCNGGECNKMDKWVLANDR